METIGVRAEGLALDYEPSGKERSAEFCLGKFRIGPLAGDVLPSGSGFRDGKFGRIEIGGCTRLRELGESLAIDEPSLAGNRYDNGGDEDIARRQIAGGKKLETQHDLAISWLD